MPRTRPGQSGCVFCEIVEGRVPARFEHAMSDEGRLETHPELVVFHNRLDWARVMLLVVPRAHMSQAAFWTSRLIAEAGSLAVKLGDAKCPEGFRLISNFGRSAHQSQEHAHLHVISGASPADTGDEHIITEIGDVKVHQLERSGVPLAVKFLRSGVATQRAMWTGGGFSRVARAAIEFASEHTPEGFRLLSEFRSPATGQAGGGSPGLYLHGGGQLDLYM